MHWLRLAREEWREPDVGFRSGERCGDGFVLSHFSNDNDIGILPEDVNQCAAEGLGICGDFLLNNDGFAVFVNKLNGVLDGHHFTSTFLVDVIDHTIQRRRLTRSSRTGDQKQAAWTQRHFQHLGRESELFMRRDMSSTESKARLWTAISKVKSDADSSTDRMEDGDAEFPVLFKNSSLVVVE